LLRAERGQDGADGLSGPFREYGNESVEKVSFLKIIFLLDQKYEISTLSHWKGCKGHPLFDK
jgi:hypothetical protein